MVFTRSEYRKQYKDPIWNGHFPHYKEKVDYRVYRRRMEHHHEIFDWDSSDSENDQGDIGAAPNNSRTAPNKNNNQGQEYERRVPPHRTDEPQTQSEMRQEQDVPQPDQVLQRVKPLRLKKPKPQRDVRTAAARPHTAPGGKRVDVGKERAPMIAFGWADRELKTGSKKTHNIKASADIYPSALRAMRRRELDIQRQQEQDKQSRKEQKLRALFNIQPRDDTMWTTEYRRNFIGPSR
ncbi:centriole, cilia and spindle-associated protein-like isoform X3 [Asterias rubens]|uniref:centriole, cilia and spindle-associated protein-like isoform X3 n=1 Tax=Asterias rubens TaxID=7604 RepID=UPI0014558BF8|nr:centriole, cilia and spindle-associated protein-like isoform X3 [Asterias rubens]